MFDNVLVEQLGYAVPVQLRQLLADRNFGPFGSILDLGCGTGLTGGELRDRAEFIAGVDISENMVELAFDREVYDELFVGEALQFLQSGEGERWDLIAATDVMPYLGELKPLINAAAERLGQGGLLAFSTETLPQGVLAGRDYMVGPYQRFAHAESYVRRKLEEAALTVEAFEPITVRHEQGRADCRSSGAGAKVGWLITRQSCSPDSDAGGPPRLPHRDQAAHRHQRAFG